MDYTKKAIFASGFVLGGIASIVCLVVLAMHDAYDVPTIEQQYKKLKQENKLLQKHIDDHITPIEKNEAVLRLSKALKL